MINKSNIEKKIFSPDEEVCTHAILEMVLNSDYEEVDWVSNILIKLTESENPTISGLALVCFGHLARLHKYIGERERIIGILRDFQKSPLIELRGRAEDALDDIKIFLG